MNASVLVDVPMRYLVVGGGGREHAIAASLVRDETAGLAAVMATRNPGIAPLANALLLAPETDVSRVVRFAVESGVDLAVIGPEAPLEAGLVDALTGAGIPAFGPSRAAARIETDKAWARDLLTRHGIPGCPGTASSPTLTRPSGSSATTRVNSRSSRSA